MLAASVALATLDDKRLPRPVVRKLRELHSGDFLDEAINILAFGLPGVGKSHALAALGHALVEQGRPPTHPGTSVETSLPSASNAVIRKFSGPLGRSRPSHSKG